VLRKTGTGRFEPAELSPRERDLRGFLGIDPAVPAGYEKLDYVVLIKGNGTKEQFAEIHEALVATSPNFYNVSRAVALKPTLVVE
jgi:hypothetical protein